MNDSKLKAEIESLCIAGYLDGWGGDFRPPGQGMKDYDILHTRVDVWHFAAALVSRVRAEALEEAAKACELESVVMATRDQSRGALHCATKIRALASSDHVDAVGKEKQ